MIELPPEDFRFDFSISQIKKILTQHNYCIAALIHDLIASEAAKKLYPRELKNFPPTAEEREKIIKGFISRQNGFWEDLSYPEHEITFEKLKDSAKGEYLINFQRTLLERLKSIEIQDIDSAKKVIHCSIFYSILCENLLKSLGKNQISKSKDRHVLNYEIVDLGFDLLMAIISKAYEIKGYWIAKMERRKTGTESASAKTLKKQNRMDEVWSIYEKHDYQLTKKMIVEAMGKAEVGEKTVRNYIKELEQKRNSE